MSAGTVFVMDEIPTFGHLKSAGLGSECFLRSHAGRIGLHFRLHDWCPDRQLITQTKISLAE
jgi:hypothetical protein